LNPNYVAIIKQNIDKLFVVGFIKPVEKATWLLQILIVPKKNGKLIICVNFKKHNVTTNKYPLLLPFIDEVINTVVGHEVFTYLDEFSRYH
jgi:hypothetical protein